MNVKYTLIIMASRLPGLILILKGFANTLSYYATKVFLPYTASQLQHVSRLDAVWGENIADT